MKNLWKNILRLNGLLGFSLLAAAIRIDVLMVECEQIPHLQPRSLPYELKEYPQSLFVYNSEHHKWEQRQEFQKAPWRIKNTYSWVVPSFQQKSYSSLIERRVLSYPVFKTQEEDHFFWKPRLFYAPLEPIAYHNHLIGYAEIYSIPNQQKIKMNLCLETDSGVLNVQDTFSYMQWVIVDNPYLTALIHLEKIP